MDLFDQLKEADKDRKKRVNSSDSATAVALTPKVQKVKVRIERNRSLDMAENENGRETRKRSIRAEGNSPEAKQRRQEQVSHSGNVSPGKTVATPATNASPMAPKIRSCYVRLKKMKMSLPQTSPSRKSQKKRDPPESTPTQNADLKRLYGKQWFRCHVRLSRFLRPDRIVKTKTASKNLSVSFSDEVEICGKKASTSDSGVLVNEIHFTLSSSESNSPSKNSDSPNMDIDAPEKDGDLTKSEIDTPKMDIGTPKMDIGTPEKVIGMPEKVIGTPEKVMGTPEKVIGTPEKVMGTPEKVISTPGKVIRTPEIVISTPEKVISTPEKVIGSSTKDVRSPKVHIGTPKKDIGTPKKDFGTPKKDLGTPKKDLGTPKKGLGTPKKDLGTPKKDLGTPKKALGTPIKDLGTPKNTMTAVTSETVDSSLAKEKEPVETTEEMNGLIALKAYEEDEDEKDDAAEDEKDACEEHLDKVDITTVAEIHQDPGEDDDKAETTLLNGSSSDDGEVEKKEEPSPLAITPTEETNCEDIAGGDELALPPEESKEPSFHEALQDDPILPVTFDDNSSGSFASAEGQAHLNDDDSAIEKIRSFIDEKSNTEDNRIHDNEEPDLSMLTGEHQYTALTAKSRPALHTFENRFSVLHEDDSSEERANDNIRLCVEEVLNITEDVALPESNLNLPAVLFEEDDAGKGRSTIETMLVEQPDGN